MAINPLFPQLWSARITYYAQQFSAFLPNATRAWEGEAVYGNTVKIPTIERDVTLRDYSRTADLAAPEDIDASTQDLLIDQEKYFSFALEDLDATQSRIPGATLIDLKSQGAAIKIATTVDTHVAGKLIDIAAGDLLINKAAAAFDLDFIAEVKKLLTLHGLSFRNAVIVTTPEVIETIEKGIIDKTFGDALASAQFASGTADDPTATGGLAMIVGGMRIYVSAIPAMRLKKGNNNFVPTLADRGNQSRTIIYAPQDLALVQQVNKVEPYRLEKRFATGIKGLTNYGAKSLNDGRIMRYTFDD